MQNDEFVDVKLLGYEFRVVCPAREIDTLKKAVEWLNQRIEEIKSAGKTVETDRIVLMAALSISHDYMKLTTTEDFDIIAFQRRITDINNLINTALQEETERLL